MLGMDAGTGKPLGGIDHLWQSVFFRLATLEGSCVGDRLFGSRLPLLIDAPGNDETTIEIYAAVAQAMQREPRFELQRVTSRIGPGQITVDLIGVYLPNGEPVTLEGITIT